MEDFKLINITTHIEGFDKVMANLNKELEGIKNRSVEGLIMAAAFVRRDTEKTPPITPVDLGNLRASWFVVSAKGKAQDPLGVSGNFRQGRGKQARSKDFIAKMKQGHVQAINESAGIVRSNEAGKQGKFVVAGYSANYALWVHEMIGAVKWSRPNSGPKWFESAVYRNRDTIVKIVRDKAKVK